MSNPTNTPAAGYVSAGQLADIVKDQTTAYLKTEAVKFASTQASSINAKLGKAGISEGLSKSAINQAVQGARSASEKLNGALGGKLSSVLGAGSVDLSGATKQITNAATGAVSQATSLVQNKLGSALSGVLGSSVGGLLGNALSMVPDSAAKNLTAAKIAPGFLQNGPKDDTLVTDPYGVSDNNILNSLGEKISGFAQDMFGELRSSPSLVSDLTSMLTNGGNFAISKEGLADRVLGALGGQSGLIRNLSDQLKGSIVNGMGLPEGIYDTAISLIGGQSSSINVGSINSAKEIFSLISTITRSNELGGLFDVGGESSLLAGVMREAIALGVPDAIDVLIENAKHDDIAYNALYANMQVAVDYSDLDTINTMIERVGVNAFLGQCPDAVQRLLSSYELPVGTSSANYDNEWAALETVLNTLKPGWGKVDRDGALVNDLTFYANVSGDARKLMLRVNDHLVPVLIGSTYPDKRDMISELRTMYPLVPLVKPA
jgi:hypothetical protein